MSSYLDPYFYAYNPELLAFENAWVNFMKNGQINTSVIKRDVAKSWLRCKEAGLNSTLSEPIPVLPENKVREKIEANSEILRIVYPYMESLYHIMMGSGFVIEYVDKDGYILKSIGDSNAMEVCKKTNSIPGANRLESATGTSAIALAFETKNPTQIAGAEHYLQELHRWTCSAAPVLDRTGNVLCVLNVAGRYEMIHRHTLGMVSAAAKAIENEISIQKFNEKLIENNNQLQTLLKMVSDGIIYMSRGEIIQINQCMCDLLGKSSHELLGHSAYELISMTPNLAEYLEKNTGDYSNEKITLHGRGQNHNCFLNVQPVLGEFQQKIGNVLIFKRIEEIKTLASKIKFQTKYSFDDIIGESPAIRKTKSLALKASEHDVRVIIEGESGTGKEMFAQAIHNQGERKNAPFIPIDCGALSVELLESELFGYEGGAFTGAKREGKTGVFEMANGGTVFLDEIGNMSIEMQQKLLRALQENIIVRVGGTKQIPVNVRIIAATNTSLEEKVSNGSFRRDLYYRLNVIQIKTPSLRDRRDDIPLLVENYLSQSAIPSNRKKIDNKALSILVNYDWPGNVRQLINTIKYASIMCDRKTITSTDLPLELLGKESWLLPEQFARQLSLKHAMSDYIRYIVKTNNGNVSNASKILGISRTTVYKFLEEGFISDGI